MHDNNLIDLIARCALKDQQALRSLYDETSTYLKRVAFNIVRSEEWSEEVLQEAYIQIWNNALDYRPGKAKPLTWMCSIVRYRALDKLSVERKHSKQVDAHSSLDDVHSGQANIEQLMSAKQNNSMLSHCMNTLTDSGKECIQMAYLYGHSREELAEHFNQNINTIKSWLHRNVKRLKRCMEEKSLIQS